MSDLPARLDLEKALAAAIGKRLDGAFKKLMAYLGDPPALENVPATFWSELGAGLTADIKPKLQQVFQDSAEAVASSFDVAVSGAVDWTLVNQAAASWAKQYVYDLIGGLTDTTRLGVQDAISSFFSDQLTIQDVRDLLAADFGPVRASNIATTEITRASNRGEWATVQSIEDNSIIEMVAAWDTSEDEHVCDICDGLDGRPEDGRDENGEPYWIHPDTGERYGVDPAHPRCRCRRSYVPKGWE